MIKIPQRIFLIVVLLICTISAITASSASGKLGKGEQSEVSNKEVVRGVVLDERGRGVAGVVVSDGFGVCKSDAGGRFSFVRAERARFVFMSTPDGYEQVGSFFYRVDGKGGVGSVDGVGDGIGDSSGNGFGESARFRSGADELVFRVVKSVARDARSAAVSSEFLHLGDTEARIHKDWVDVLKEYLVYNRPAFVLFNGDICYENGLRFHARELTSGNLGVRAVYTLGNHDLVDGAYGEELYEELFGPVWYSFNSGGVHFVNIPVLQGDRKPSYSADDVYSWLKKDLDAIPEGMPVVLLDHHFVGYSDDFHLKGESASVNLLDYNFKAYLYAHYHINLIERSARTGVTTIATMSPNKGGIDHTPSSFRSIRFDREGNLDSQIRYASLKGHIAATIFPANNFERRVSSNTSASANKGASANEKTTAHEKVSANNSYELIANIYDTRTDVEEATVEYNGAEYNLHKVSEWTWRATLPGGERASGATVSGASATRATVSGASATRGAVSGATVSGAKASAVVTAKFKNGTVVKGVARVPADIGEFTPRREDAFVPQIKWVASLGNHTFMTSPLVYGDLVISATYDDNGKGGSAIHALRKGDGSVAWSFPVANPIKNNLALWEGTLLGCDVLGNLYAIEASTGRVVWSKALRDKELHPVYTQGVTVHNGVVYAGHGHYLTALKVLTGEVVWKNTAWRGGVCTVASPVVEPESGVLLTAAYWTGRFAHNAVTGELLWAKKDDDTRIADNSPVYFKGRFFYASPGFIMEVDPLSGNELVKHKINYTINNNSRPVVTDKLFILGTTDKGVAAFDRENGYKELWNFKTNPGIIYTAPYTKDFQMTVESGAFLDRVAISGESLRNGGDISKSGSVVEGVASSGGDGGVGGERGVAPGSGVEYEEVLYFGANDGYLYSVNARSGVFRWRINLGAPVLGNIVVSVGGLYASDFAGNVWAVSLK
jgi:outer membrane protein assembly factor BamB